MFKWLKKKNISPIYVTKGDSLILTGTDEKGEEHEFLRTEIDETLTINTIGTFKFKDEFDLKEGIGGIFGEE